MSSFPHPHRLALFSLQPLNEQAKKVASHPYNQHLTSRLNDGTIVLDIGFHIRSRSHHTIATLGRGNADIFVEGTNISKIQCSFEIEPTTNVIMLYDRSHGRTTKVSGQNATPFENGRLRQVVVQKNLNDVLGMGGKTQDVVKFQLLWYENTCLTKERVKELECTANDYEENRCLARTADELETLLPSQMQTRIHTPGLPQLKMRYMKIERLGSGQFGVVYKAIDIDTGRLLAVKIFQQPEHASKEAEWRKTLYYALKREVEALSKISHPHIIDFITSQGWDGPAAEIFMGLKDGTLKSLVLGGEFLSVHNLAKCVCHQMLQALDCLAVNGIVHRDVKPENILYTALPGAEYQFHLGDFGLCNRTVSARSSVGTPLYTAPEIFEHGIQTHKVDVSSLFVTIAWTLDFDGFRQSVQHFTSLQQAQQALLAITSKIGDIQEMARVDPDERASAAQMLVKRFDGEGLSTQRNQVPPLSPPNRVTRPEAELHSVPMPKVNYLPPQDIQKVPKQPTNLARVPKSSNSQARVLGPSTRAAKPRASFLSTDKRQLLSDVVESPGFLRGFRVQPSSKD